MDVGALATALDSAGSVLVVTGAGVSAPAGLGTFRGAGGPPSWLETAMSADRWHEDYEASAARWDEFRSRVEDAVPTVAHRVLSGLETLARSRGSEFTVATQNVDGLHTRAGSAGVLEVHGVLDPVDRVAPDGVLRSRPDAVFFGERIRYGEELSALAERVEVLVVIGSSGVVFPVAGLPSRVNDRYRGPGPVYPERGRVFVVNAEAWRPELLFPVERMIVGLADDVLAGVAEVLGVPIPPAG